MMGGMYNAPHFLLSNSELTALVRQAAQIDVVPVAD
jgi:hypothetical protein